MSQDAAEDITVATVGESVVTSMTPAPTPKKEEAAPLADPVPEEEGEEDGLYPFTTPREEFFDKRTWWMVDLACVEDDAPNQGATPLVARCMRVHGWDEEYTRRVLTAYKQFLMLKAERKDWKAKELSPCADVEKMWQLHIVDMGNYFHDCKLICGHIVDYNPDEALDENAKASREKNTQVALKAKFGSRLDEELWNNVGFSKPGLFRASTKGKVAKTV